MVAELGGSRIGIFFFPGEDDFGGVDFEAGELAFFGVVTVAGIQIFSEGLDEGPPVKGGSHSQPAGSSCLSLRAISRNQAIRPWVRL